MKHLIRIDIYKGTTAGYIDRDGLFKQHYFSIYNNVNYDYKQQRI